MSKSLETNRVIAQFLSFLDIQSEISLFDHICIMLGRFEKATNGQIVIFSQILANFQSVQEKHDIWNHTTHLAKNDNLGPSMIQMWSDTFIYIFFVQQNLQLQVHCKRKKRK